MTVRIITLGCKVNQCESASISAALRSRNIIASEGQGPADVYILNTCSVTAEADKKSRQYVSKLRKHNPKSHIIVVGCSSQNNPTSFAKDNVIAIGGTHCKTAFAMRIIDKLLNNNQYNTISDIVLYDENIGKIGYITEFCCENRPIFEKTRAFLKIQEGCNRFCSYCIIPYLRGRSRSRFIDDILTECMEINAKEVVLTGIDISAYGRDIGTSLTELIDKLSTVDMRIRLGSLECEIIDDELLESIVKGNVCPHFHLSLQSGSDNVLKSMNRHYTAGLFFEKTKLIRKYLPLAGITTDIIVGFPTETEENFEESYEFIEKCAFSDIHVFPYSSRSGTLASKKYKCLDPEIVRARVDKLLGLKGRLHKDFLNKNLGLCMPVYVEDCENGYNVGYTPNYIKVYSQEPCGKIVDLKLKKLYGSGIIGVSAS